jgi:hypothetical protein
MKFTTLSFATLAASAHQLMPEEPSTEMIDMIVGSGICQTLAGYDFYDLTDFDALGRDKKKHTPASVEYNDGGMFSYKVCQPAWTSTLDTKCAKEGTAYFSDNGDCKYSFTNADFVETEATNADGVKTSTGFKLQWQSNEACGDGKFEYEMTAVCDKDAAGSWSAKESSTCKASATYTGKEGCKAYTFEIQKYMDLIAPAIGAFLIVFGGVMAFMGSKFIF